jgi:prophage DNA circulation protein
MSGFTNITGLPDPTSLAGFLGSLQVASFRGVPFKVDASELRVGRRQAMHEYPFVDGGWPEDMGRAPRTYSFTGHLIGDFAPAMQLALNTVLELEGSGLLIHPSVGAVQVSVLTGASAVQKDNGRVISVALAFVEDTGQVFPIALIATAVSVALLVLPALLAANEDLGGVAGPAALVSPAAIGEGVTVVRGFADAVILGGGDATAIVGMATAIAAPNADTSYGRYAAGSASLVLPEGTTVASLQAELADQRAATAGAGDAVTAVVTGYSASTDVMTPLAAVLGAMSAGIKDPAQQLRVLATLAGFTFADNVSGLAGTGAAMVTVRDAMAAACRRAAVIALAQASASYQPSSYDDALAVRTRVAEALDAEITAAGDSGEDATYTALKQLRSAAVRDLTVRGAALPTIVRVTLPGPLPSLVIAQRLYRDASRSDEITAESQAVHPAFCPATFNALAQ